VSLPQLKVGQSTICGALEICQFLSESGRLPDMAGSDPVEKSSIDLWVKWIDENLVMPDQSNEEK